MGACGTCMDAVSMLCLLYVPSSTSSFSYVDIVSVYPCTHYSSVFHFLLINTNIGCDVHMLYNVPLEWYYRYPYFFIVQVYTLLPLSPSFSCSFGIPTLTTLRCLYLPNKAKRFGPLCYLLPNRRDLYPTDTHQRNL